MVQTLADAASCDPMSRSVPSATYTRIYFTHILHLHPCHIRWSAALTCSQPVRVLACVMLLSRATCASPKVQPQAQPGMWPDVTDTGTAYVLLENH